MKYKPFWVLLCRIFPLRDSLHSQLPESSSVFLTWNDQSTGIRFINSLIRGPAPEKKSKIRMPALRTAAPSPHQQQLMLLSLAELVPANTVTHDVTAMNDLAP
jgi:hypothetical protein